MSMLFVHFQNQQFEKWTVSRVSGIFFLQKFPQNQYGYDLGRQFALFRQKITQIVTSV